METRESVQNFAPSPRNQVFEPRIGLHGGGRSPPPYSRTFASILVTLQICGLIIVVDRMRVKTKWRHDLLKVV